MPATPKSVLEGWFAAFHCFNGLVLVLQAFFDETGGDEKAAMTAVAGFVYDKPGLEHFTEKWPPKIASLSRPYRSASCNAGYPPFGPPDWSEPRRQSLMDELGILSAETAVAGFVIATTEADFQKALENVPKNRMLIDSPYTLCTLAVLSAVSNWASKSAAGKRIYCWFETGGYHWKEAQKFVGRIANNPQAVAQFSAIAGQSWLSKEDAPAFCSADLLAWEWQRNALRSPDQWTPRITKMFSRMRKDSKPVYADHLTANDTTLWAMFTGISGLFED